MTRFPELPIVTPDPPRKSETEKYGGLLYLGLGGLVVLVLLLGWFGYSVWTMGPIWSDIYLLNDTRRPEEERVQAAWRLARDPRVTQRQRWDLALSRTPPPLARYLLAESLTSEAVEADPRGYALAVSRSEGWPPWLRMLLARPLAYAAGEGVPVDRESLDELAGHADPTVARFARFALRVSSDDRHADEPPGGPVDPDWARLMDEAERAEQPRLDEILDRATLLLRRKTEAGAKCLGRVERFAGRDPTDTGPGIASPDPDRTASRRFLSGASP